MTLEEAIRHAEEKAKCGGRCGEDHAQLAEWLKELRERRTAESEKRTEERTETHACDSVNRQAAIDAVGSMLRRKFGIGGDLAEITLAGLPSAQPNLQPTCNQLATDTISRQAAIEAMDGFNACGYVEEPFERLEKALKEIPAAQPEIIRCKDCKYWREYKYVNGKPKYLPYCGFNAIYFREDDYCSHAERREG